MIMYQYLLGKVSTKTTSTGSYVEGGYQYLLGKVSTNGDPKKALVEFVSISIR